MSLKTKTQKGNMLITVLIATGLFMVIFVGAIGLAQLQNKLNVEKIAQTQALYIAESGVNYYRWVLYHKHAEYCNNGPCIGSPNYGPYGPFTYTDQTGTIKGHYQLYIIPPAINGSTIVTVKSIGWSDKYPNMKRTIEVKCGIPAWSTYSTLVNSELSYGASAEVWGPIHSNTQIKMDGIAHNLVSAYLLTSNIIEGNNEWGVYTHNPADNHPPTAPVNRPAVFMAGRIYGPGNVSLISFAPLSNYANDTYALATSSGLVFDPRKTSSCGTDCADPYAVTYWKTCLTSGGAKDCSKGFLIRLKANNKFDMYGVKAVSGDCPSGNPSWSYTAAGLSAPVEYTVPANGIVFVKNNTWVEGTVNNATGTRITILAYTNNFANANNTNIIVNNDIRYTKFDGTDSIGLIAQNDVLIGLKCADALTIDAALVAVNGSRHRPDYSGCNPDTTKTSLTIYGSTASFDTPYMTSGSSGFNSRDYIYDPNLTYSPPPHYPTTGEYTFISWEEK